MKSFVFTLGFHEDFIERRLHTSHAVEGDAIRVFTCKPLAPATRRAYESLRARAYSIGVGEPELIPLECIDPAEALYTARLAIRELPEPIIADLSGGMRIAVLVVYTALLLERKQFDLYIQPEPWGQETLIPHQITQLIWSPLAPEEQRLLETITALGKTTIKQLAEIMNRKEKTIANKLAKLRKHMLITKRGRTPTIQPTKWAKTITTLPPHPDQIREQKHHNKSGQP